MIRISKMADYGVAIMAELAQEEGRLSASELGERISLGVESSAKILKMLTKGGLVTSARGKSGGYELAKSAEEISLLSIVEAVDGAVRLTDCANDCPKSGDPCGREASCLAKATMRDLSAAIRGMLGKIPLSAIDGETRLEFGALEPKLTKGKSPASARFPATIGEIGIRKRASEK